jgi:hypothetical protein
VTEVTEDTRTALVERTDAIEQAYEFMLAYAARGRQSDDATDPDGDIRAFLDRARNALDGLVEAALAHVQALGLDARPWRAYLDIVAADAERAGAALALVLAQPAIGSALIDNLNASLHLRSLLTDVFLIDSAFDAARQR